LSSFLQHKDNTVSISYSVSWTRPDDGRHSHNAHLLAAKDQPLLHRRDALLLFHALLYAGHLFVHASVCGSQFIPYQALHSSHCTNALDCFGPRWWSVRRPGRLCELEVARAWQSTFQDVYSRMKESGTDGPCSLARYRARSPCPSGYGLCEVDVRW